MDRSGRDDAHRPSSLLTERGDSLKVRVERLTAKLSAALDADKPFDLGNYLHTEITEALRGLVFAADPATARSLRGSLRAERKDALKGRLLQVRYSDGSAGARFPLRVLPQPTWAAFRSDLALMLGTLTLRHREYESVVDLFLLRDRETRGLSNGEVEDLAYRRMTEILDDPDLGDEAYLMLHQSGLEPLVVGACRAVVSSMLTHPTRRTLMFRPIYSVQEDGTMSAGKDWICQEAAR